MAKKKTDEEILDTPEVKEAVKAKKTSKKAETKAEEVIAETTIVEADAEEAPKKKRITKSRTKDTEEAPAEEAVSTPVEAVAEVVTEPVQEVAPAPVVEEYTGPRYSDDDLEEFRVRIIEVRHEALDELRMLRERLEDYTSYDFAEESMIYSMHMAEQGPEALEQEKTYAQVQRISEYIKKLDDALIRIKDKTFGVCRVCKCLIAKERLLAVPITTLSAAYKIHKKCPQDGIDRIEPLKK